MLTALASAALIVAGSLAVGHATLVAGHLRDGGWRAGPVGLALLLAVGGIAASLGARGALIAALFGALALAASVILIRERRLLGELAAGPALAALAAATFAALPFIAAGAVGILGVGLVNDDMASHLLMADWVEERFRPEPVFIDQGYPLGPHGLVAGLASLLDAGSIDVFAGLVLAIPALTALVAHSALHRVAPVPRTLASALVALPYMAAAYLAQEAFKEPILALFVLAFALLLPTIRRPRQAVPLGILAAGTIYVYSFPGLAWLLGALVAWLAIEAIRGRARPASARSVLVATGVGLAAFAVLIAPEIPRLIDFKDFRALHPDRANEGGLGNLNEQLSPLTALGVWPTGSFRLSAGDGTTPAIVFYAGAAVAGLAFLLALPRWVRGHGTSHLAALAAAAGIYVGARLFGTVYTSAKALSIIAPLIMLAILGGLLAGRPGERAARSRALLALGVVVGLAGAFSSFLVLRQAPVAPEGHIHELATIRPHVEGEKLLFLGRDNFVLYELRGSKPFVAVKNYYDPYYVRPNRRLDDVFSKFDFDSVRDRDLARFRYVLTTRAEYASGPPPGYTVAVITPSYVLWERGGSPGRREPAEAGAEPGARLDRCGPELRGRVGAAFAGEPVVAPAERWSTTTLESGSEATTSLELERGRWQISLQYDATRPVTLTARFADGSSKRIKTLPGNLDYRGPAPFWAAGRLEVARPGPVEIVATVERPPLLGRILGVESVAHLNAIAATRAMSGYAPGERPVPGGSERLLSGEALCGKYVDWTAPASAVPAARSPAQTRGR